MPYGDVGQIDKSKAIGATQADEENGELTFWVYFRQRSTATAAAAMYCPRRAGWRCAMLPTTRRRSSSFDGVRTRENSASNHRRQRWTPGANQTPWLRRRPNECGTAGCAGESWRTAKFLDFVVVVAVVVVVAAVVVAAVVVAVVAVVAFVEW